MCVVCQLPVYVCVCMYVGMDACCLLVVCMYVSTSECISCQCHRITLLTYVCMNACVLFACQSAVCMYVCMGKQADGVVCQFLFSFLLVPKSFFPAGE